MPWRTFCKKEARADYSTPKPLSGIDSALRVFDRHAESRKILNQNFRTQSIFPN